jgi:hypothetical protein
VLDHSLSHQLLEHAMYRRVWQPALGRHIADGSTPDRG